MVAQTHDWRVVELRGPNRDGEPVRFEIADGNAVSKGTLCVLTDPRTTTGKAVSGAVIAGVALEEKNANDGATSISLWTDGIFEVTASGVIALGDGWKSAGDNHVGSAGAASLAAVDFGGARIPGYSMETGADAELIEVRLKL